MAEYVKTVWTDEVPDTTPIKYEIIEDTPDDLSSVQINIITDVTAGTALSAANLNKIEQGIHDAQDAVDTLQADFDAGTILTTPSSTTQVAGVRMSLTAGETMSFGEVGYIKSDSKIWKADASVIGTAPAIAICADSSIIANASGYYMFSGIARKDIWTWTPGGIIYLSVTGGAMTQTAPTATDEVIQVLGFALSATVIYFNPQFVVLEHV